MPRPACDPTVGTVCTPRQRAREEGTFRWDRRRRGWYWLDCRTADHPWHRCPFCDGPLPVGGELSDRVLDALRQADGTDDAAGEGAE